jgi:hypothetical protein
LQMGQHLGLSVKPFDPFQGHLFCVIIQKNLLLH